MIALGVIFCLLLSRPEQNLPRATLIDRSAGFPSDQMAGGCFEMGSVIDLKTDLHMVELSNERFSLK